MVATGGRDPLLLMVALLQLSLLGRVVEILELSLLLLLLPSHNLDLCALVQALGVPALSPLGRFEQLYTVEHGRVLQHVRQNNKAYPIPTNVQRFQLPLFPVLRIGKRDVLQLNVPRVLRFKQPTPGGIARL